MSEPEPVKVEAYAGASFPEYPVAVWLENRRLEVLKIIRQWRTPEELHFLVKIDQIGRSELIYPHRTDIWCISF